MRFVSALFVSVCSFSVWGQIAVDYPRPLSLFPPDFAAPTFLYRDASAAVAWSVEIHFAAGKPLKAPIDAPPNAVGPIDPAAVSDSNEPPRLTAEQAAARAWKPAEALWSEFKRRSQGAPATIRFYGYSGPDRKTKLSEGEVRLSTSTDPVAAPIFYRDVPLMPNQNDKGVIKPLPAGAVGLIQWRLRYVNEPQSHVVMEKLSTCANCHSFSLDGKTMGLDVDGPQNDRALYALLDVKPQMTLANSNVIRWPTVRDSKIERLRASFMSQVSPDGRFVVTTVDDPEASAREGGRSLEDKYYNANFMDYRFLQVFYPTRGILAWYDRSAAKLKPLPGADDPRYVQTDGVWSPDGQWIVFARASARSPYTPGAPLALRANDPNETQIQYDLYRIPFNNGLGGKPERIAGASENGLSNNFPKVSPDGRWIVFVQCKNGQLMRPDSQLYIVPFAGGAARRLESNMELMNSWHSFSPNGRWMAFSSKARSPYTQMYLTHLDADGHASPAILIENSTAANRAVNLPEFVNIGPGGMLKIDAPATDFYRLFNEAIESMKANRFAEAAARWREALAINPADGKARFNLAYSLGESGAAAEALREYAQATTHAPDDPLVFANYALALAQNGQLAEAVAAYRKSLALDPTNAPVWADLGTSLFEHGNAAEAVEALQKALQLAPGLASAHDKLGSILAKTNRLPEALGHLRQAVDAEPARLDYRFNYGYALGMAGDYAAAIPQMEKAVELSEAKEWQPLALLGMAYSKAGRFAEAARVTRQALALAEQAGLADLARNLRQTAERFEAQR